jgi:serine/threonine protein kinase/tetratricopeptide (TPR) repeat protein
MATIPSPPTWAEIDPFVEAYERERGGSDQTGISEYLPPKGHTHYFAVLRELVRVDLEHRWDREQPRPLDEYLAEFPELRTDPDGVQAIAFEEYRLRRQAGEDPSAEEYRRRYGVNTLDWPRTPTHADFGQSVSSSDLSGPGDEPAASPFERLQELASAYLHHSRSMGQDTALELEGTLRAVSKDAGFADLFLELHDADPRVAHMLAEGFESLPREGAQYQGFQLVRELGRGAFARVFLARQNELANRLVALKLSIELPGESQTLAQLQHTNIVPIYSAHYQAPIQAICMPYFGRVTLADVRAELRKLPSPPPLADWLVQLLVSKRSTAPTGLSEGRTIAPDPSPLARMRGMSYTDAVLWIGAQLAAALAHAHDRGIVHGDLKPANVLLSDEGQPMLLDFNLSEDVKLPGRASAAQIGGTLPYMAPEQLAAFRAGCKRTDPRSDVYALGLLLFELLCGRFPFPLHKGRVDDLLGPMIADRSERAPDLRRWNSGVPRAVASILRHCLHPDPANRYGSAHALHEDVSRQLASLPLKHAPDPSPRERVGKWFHRHPRLTSSYVVGAVASMLLLVVFTILAARSRQLDHERAGHAFHQFGETLQECQFLLGSPDPDRDALREGIQRAEESLDRYQVLNNPRWDSSTYVTSLAPAERDELRRTVRQLLLFLAGGVRRDARLTEDIVLRDELQTKALRLNKLAESCYEGDENLLAVYLERSLLLHDLGRDAEAAELETRMRLLPARTCEELLLLALQRREQKDYVAAQEFLHQAQHRDPRNPLIWYWLGACALDVFDYREARASFTTSVALWPRFHGTYYERGRAAARLGKHAEALADLTEAIRLRPQFGWAYNDRGWEYVEIRDFKKALSDFDEAIRLQPSFIPAYVNRAIVKESLNDLPGALADLTLALENGGLEQQARAYYRRSIVRSLLGDHAGAKKDREQLLRCTPQGEINWIARGLARISSDPAGALADFSEALHLNPRSLPALENKAYVLAEHMGRTQEAVTVLDEVIALYPDRVPSIASRGVLHARLRHRQPAVADAVEALRFDKSPEIAYQVAGIYALTSQQQPEDLKEALRLLDAALREGYGLDLLDSDPELKPIRSHPEFRRIVDAARSRKKDARPAAN